MTEDEMVGWHKFEEALGDSEGEGETNGESSMEIYTLKVKVKLLSRVRLFEAPWTVAYQAPLSMGFSRQ